MRWARLIGLGFDGGIPPWVEKEDVLGGSQVQAQSTGLEADEKQLGFGVILKSLDGVARCAYGRRDIRNVRRLYPVGCGRSPESS